MVLLLQKGWWQLVAFASAGGIGILPGLSTPFNGLRVPSNIITIFALKFLWPAVMVEYGVWLHDSPWFGAGGNASSAYTDADGHDHGPTAAAADRHDSGVARQRLS